MIEIVFFDDYDMVKEVYKLFCRYLSEPYAYPTLTYYFATHSSISFVAKINSTVIGAILCMANQNEGQISMLCVDEEYRRLGIGKYLICRSILEMKNEGIRRVELETNSSNDIALDLYEKVGFKRTNFYERCYFNLENSYAMALDLTTAGLEDRIRSILDELERDSSVQELYK